jgi:hypothetical protein
VTFAALHHFDPATVEAAQSLLNRLDAFGNITRKSYEEEVLDVNLLLGDLRSAEYAAKASLVGLNPWIQELQTAENDFEHLLEQRNVETSRKPQGRIKDVRRDLDTVYRRIVDRIDAATTLEDGSTTYDEFIAELNARITYFNHHAHQHARKDLSVGDACVIETLSDQTYTGKAVTPLPHVFSREEGKPTVELVFAKDFFVTYKNNVDVGMADLVIHGKGTYKGQKKITFNIFITQRAKLNDFPFWVGIFLTHPWRSKSFPFITRPNLLRHRIHPCILNHTTIPDFMQFISFNQLFLEIFLSDVFDSGTKYLQNIKMGDNNGRTRTK